MRKPIGIVGVPTSAGAYAPGQEQAPRALRAAGLVDRLQRNGLDIVDHGDSPVWRWSPDRNRRRAQNLATVVEQAERTAARVGDILAQEQFALVLGGDCTVELGTVAGHLARGEEGIGLIYFDIHADLNTPESVVDGALDWMGMAHLLGEEQATEPLSRFGPRFPLLRSDQLLLFAVGHDQCTAWERGVIARRALKTIPNDAVAADPIGTASEALAWANERFDRVLIHFDVDVIDFADAPLSENTGRNVGLSFDTAMRALASLLDGEGVSALTVTELNPNHGSEDGSTLAAFASRLADAFG